MASEKAVPFQVQNGALATLTNRTTTNMRLVDSISWSGQFVTLPTTINPNGGVASIETVKGDQGSKAAVNYTITSASGASYAIILAWDAPSNFNSTAAPNKVLGLLGRKSVIDDLSWAEVRTQLNNATSAFLINDASKISMIGDITNNRTTKKADIVANFLLLP